MVEVGERKLSVDQFKEKFHNDFVEQLYAACISNVRWSHLFKADYSKMDVAEVLKRIFSFLEKFKSAKRFTLKKQINDSDLCCYYHPSVPDDIVIFLPEELLAQTDIREVISAELSKIILKVSDRIIREVEEEHHRDLIQRINAYRSTLKAAARSCLAEKYPCGQRELDLERAKIAFFEEIRPIFPELEPTFFRDIAEFEYPLNYNSSMYIPDGFENSQIDRAKIEDAMNSILLPELRKNPDFNMKMFDLDQNINFLQNGLCSKIEFVLKLTRIHFSDYDRNPFLRAFIACGIDTLNVVKSSDEIIHEIILPKLVKELLERWVKSLKKGESPAL